MEQHFFKMVIIGNSGVGKSSLLLRFCDDSFREMYLTTIGVDFKFKSVNLNGIGIKLQIWDTAGQERFRTITSSYYKGAQGIIIVYDVCSLKSFEDITKYWLNEISSFADKQVMLMLLGNKSDMGDAPREVDREMAEHFARSNSMKHYEVSAKTADQVERAFNDFAKEILNQSLESGNKTLIKEKKSTPKSLQQTDEKQKDKNCCMG